MLSTLSYVRNMYFPEHIKVICKLAIFKPFNDNLHDDRVLYGFSQGEIYDPYLEELEQQFINELLNQSK
jgi:hypothetical protein